MRTLKNYQTRHFLMPPIQFLFFPFHSNGILYVCAFQAVKEATQSVAKGIKPLCKTKSDTQEKCAISINDFNKTTFEVHLPIQRDTLCVRPQTYV